MASFARISIIGSFKTFAEIMKNGEKNVYAVFLTAKIVYESLVMDGWMGSSWVFIAQSNI